MSTCYKFDRPISKKEFLKSIKDIGVKEHICDGTNYKNFCISDGESYLWCYLNADDKIEDFCRYGANGAAVNFLEEAAGALDLELMCEEDDDYYEEE